jgi:hypothetical protein
MNQTGSNDALFLSVVPAKVARYSGHHLLFVNVIFTASISDVSRHMAVVAFQRHLTGEAGPLKGVF